LVPYDLADHLTELLDLSNSVKRGVGKVLIVVEVDELVEIGPEVVFI